MLGCLVYFNGSSSFPKECIYVPWRQNIILFLKKKSTKGLFSNKNKFNILFALCRISYVFLFIFVAKLNGKVSFNGRRLVTSLPLSLKINAKVCVVSIAQNIGCLEVYRYTQFWFEENNYQAPINWTLVPLPYTSLYLMHLLLINKICFNFPILL